MKDKVEPKTGVSVIEKADQLLIAEAFEEAEDLYSQVVSGLSELLGSNHPEVAKTLHKLAAAQAAQEKFNQAKTSEEQSKLVDAVN